ncbi:MAG TPA: YfcE family phosphodiesterase, partial [Tissierellaceae bacterium]|nr:YfcE family phosphodiesterase [Tissierellaceae bacterium]
MRILAVSDTHGRCEGIIKEVKNREKFDLLFHLGDYVEDGDKIAQELDIPAVIVRGNGDFYSHYQDEELVEFSGKTIFLTHGHMYNVRFDISNLYYRGRELGADLILFGHTHVP